MPQDTQLMSLLERAKKVCSNKHTQVAASLIGTPSTKFSDLNNEQNSLFLLLIQPSSFDSEIQAIDKLDLEAQITAVDVLDPSQFNEYLTVMESFITYLKEKVLVHLQNQGDENLTNDWNLKLLDALRMLQRKITGRKRHFNNLGADLRNDPTYKYHRVARKDYREKLKNNTIQSLATDEIVLNNFREEIIDLTVLTTFIEILERTNTFMDKKRNIAIVTPIV